jgi:hypothetical protein
MLAVATGLTQDDFGASLAWREALGPSDDLSTRLTLARALLHNPGIKLDQPTQTFISLHQGLILVVEAKSLIRSDVHGSAQSRKPAEAEPKKAEPC